MKWLKDAHLPDWSDWIQSTSGTAAWTFDPETETNWWSDEVFRIYDLPLGYTEGDPLRFYSQEDREILMAAIGACLEKHTPWDLTLDLTTETGKKKTCRSVGRFRSHEGKGIVFGTFADITEITKLERELRHQKDFLDSVLHVIPQMIFVKSARDLRFVLFNEAGEKLLGVHRDELLGKNDGDLFPDDQAEFFMDKDREVLNEKRFLDIPQEPIDTPHGKRILHTKKIALYNESNEPTHLVGISDDITERLKSEETIKNQQAALMNASKLSSLGEMAGGVAHEINNPLTIIRGIGEQIGMLLKRTPIDLDRIEKLSERLQTTVDRIARIVTGLKDFSREGGQDPYDQITVHELVDSTLAFCEERMKNRGVQLTVEVPENLTLQCQQVKISQILLNLLNNATDAIADMEGKKTILLKAEESGDQVAIRIIDNGPGVPKDKQSQIMNPFFTTKPVGKGTGLGLSVSQGIAKDHNGELTYEDKPDQGACFVLTLPKTTEEDEPALAS